MSCIAGNGPVVAICVNSCEDSQTNRGYSCPIIEGFLSSDSRYKVGQFDSFQPLRYTTSCVLFVFSLISIIRGHSLACLAQNAVTT